MHIKEQQTDRMAPTSTNFSVESKSTSFSTSLPPALKQPQEAAKQKRISPPAIPPRTLLPTAILDFVKPDNQHHHISRSSGHLDYHVPVATKNNVIIGSNRPKNNSTAVLNASFEQPLMRSGCADHSANALLSSSPHQTTPTFGGGEFNNNSRSIPIAVLSSNGAGGSKTAAPTMAIHRQLIENLQFADEDK